MKCRDLNLISMLSIARRITFLSTPPCALSVDPVELVDFAVDDGTTRRLLRCLGGRLLCRILRCLVGWLLCWILRRLVPFFLRLLLIPFVLLVRLDADNEQDNVERALGKRLKSNDSRRIDTKSSSSDKSGCSQTFHNIVVLVDYLILLLSLIQCLFCGRL